MTLADIMTFGEKIKELRSARGWTQNELATRAGLQLPLIQKLEQGRTQDPQWATVQALARALGVKTDELRTDGDG